MVIRMRKAALFLVISLVAAVISLETEAQAGTATFPSTVRVAAHLTPPAPGFGPVLGKIAKDGSDNIYVTDVFGRSVVKFDVKGQYVQTFNFSSYGRPYGLAVMKNGTMVVTFTDPKPQVVLFASDGTKLVGQGGLPTQRFQAPLAVTLDSQENIYVLDAGQFDAPKYYPIESSVYVTRFVPNTSLMCVHVFKKDGTILNTNAAAPGGYPTNSFGYPSLLYPLTVDTVFVPENGAFLSPEAITYDANRKMIAVGDTLNGRVQFFGAADNPTTALQFKYIYKLGDLLVSDPNGLHMASPTGLTLESATSGTRLYVVDKVLKRIQVIDPDQAAVAERGEINEAAYPELDLVYPRDLMEFKGNLLIANEQGPAVASLVVVDVGGGWPPPTMQLSFDYDAARLVASSFPNLAQRAGNTFPFTGKVDATATAVSYVNNEGDGAGRETSGTCAITVTGGSLNDYSCPVLFSTLQYDQDVRITASKDVAGTLVTTSISAPKIPHVNYNAAGALLYPTGPALTFTAIAPAEQYRQSNMITISGTVNYSAIAVGGKELGVEIYNSATKERTMALVDTAGVLPAKTWTATVPLIANATNTLTPSAYVELSARSVSSPVSQDVYVDTEAPAIDFVFYRKDSVVMDQVQNAAGTVADANLKSIQLDVNGTVTSVPYRRFTATDSYYFSGLALLNQNGMNNVKIIATDMAGNVSTSVTRTVNLQPMLPIGATRLSVNATAQADNLFYTKSGVPLNFQGNLPANSTLKFGSETATVTGTTWQNVTTDLVSNQSEVVVPVTIEATGAYGTVSKLRSLFVLSSAPNLAITQPAEDVAVKTGTGYTFKIAAASSATKPTVAISSVVVELTDSTSVTPVFTQTFTNPAAEVTTTAFDLVKEGVYTLKVTATNGTDTSVAYRNVLLDKTKPSVGIALDPTPNPAIIQGFVEPGATVSVKNGTSDLSVSFVDPLQPSIWSVSAASVTDVNNLVVSAVDVAGNTNSRNWQAVPDADVDGDSSLRVYDAIVALRAVVSGLADSETLKHGDIAPLVNGLPAPDGLMSIADAQLVLMKVEGKAWQ